MRQEQNCQGMADDSFYRKHSFTLPIAYAEFQIVWAVERHPATVELFQPTGQTAWGPTLQSTVVRIQEPVLTYLLQLPLVEVGNAVRAYYFYTASYPLTFWYA